MLPVLFTFGPFTVSSFGLFLALGTFAAIFLSFRLAKLYDLSEEKMIDLAILTFFGGLIGSRVFFVLTHLGIFNSPEKIIQINYYPGLSFWGGLLGGGLVFWFFTKRLQFNFWQVADLVAVSFLVGIIFGDVGCFLSGCAYGLPSTLPIATPVVGVIGKRLPISLIEALVLFPVLLYLWKQTVRFHFAGKILSLLLMVLGIVKLGTEYYRGDTLPLVSFSGRLITVGHLFAAVLLTAGIVVFYQGSKRSFWGDLREVGRVLVVEKKRQAALFKLGRSWYNQKVGWKVKAGKIKKALLYLPQKAQRKFNVKPNPTNLR